MESERPDVYEGLRVPPHNVQAEQSLLGALMLENSTWELVADKVKEEDFYRQEHRLVFRAVGLLADSDAPFDVITVAEALEKRKLLDDIGGMPYLAEIDRNTASAANAVHYARIVRFNSVLRQLVKAGTDITDLAFDTQGRSEAEILDIAETQVFKIAEQMNRGIGFRPIEELLKLAVDKIDELFHRDEPITGLPTGFTDFDRKTSGLQQSDLIIVAGRPSMGKTSFAMNMAENVAIKTGKGVAVFSMEMPGDSLAMRMMSSLGQIDQHRVRTGRLTDEDWPRLTSAVTMLSQAPMYIDDTPALSPTELRARVRRLQRDIKREDKELGMIVIDYLQLMQSSTEGENRATEISAISRSLKSLAKELSVPVIALSQLNRSLEQRPNKRPVMSDLRECVTGDTLVVLADGRRLPIADLVGTSPRVRAVDAVGKLVEAESDRVWRVGRRPIFAVRLASGRCIRATAEHRLLGADGWQRVGTLAPGARLALARQLPQPDACVEWPTHELILLAHLVGDGSYLSGQPLRYTTASPENSHIVTDCAVQFGVRINRHEGRGAWHQLVFSGNGNRWHPAGINLAPSRSMLTEYAELLGDEQLRDLATSDLFWDKVVAVEPAGEEDVYDLTVPGPSCWLADGIVSHNSGAIEQDADLIVFIYRDEVYNEDSPDKGVAEIIIGKQRNGPIGTVKLAFLGQYTKFENLAEDLYGDVGY